MNDSDARLVSRAALDAIGAAGERVIEPCRLVGIQITLVLKTADRIRMVGVTQEHRKPT